MSATPGKVLIDDITEVNGEKVFVCKFIQGRDPDWVGEVFFAKYDEKATWLNHLKPAFGKTEFFYEKRLREIHEQKEREHKERLKTFEDLGAEMQLT